MKKFEVRINITPEIHGGFMAHYWHIDLITEDGIFTVKSGWAKTIQTAMYTACRATSGVK